MNCERCNKQGFDRCYCREVYLLNHQDREELTRLARKAGRSGDADIKKLAEDMLCLAHYCRGEAEPGESFAEYAERKKRDMCRDSVDRLFNQVIDSI